ncbi:MAG TPA: hypothetical protein PLU30_26425 [Verrucomicrobiae bacterium]|nr:hypothetical protein [Verrucomicrobiae bacterium]
MRIGLDASNMSRRIERLRPLLRHLSPLASISPGWEAVIWVALIGAAILPRVALWHALPTYVWSSDSGSYVAPAIELLETGAADFGGRRGPVYSLLIAACIRWGGGLNGLVFAQHVLGATATLASIAVLRVLFGRAALPAVAACGLAACLFNLPVYLEHLVRNETLLMFTCSMALCAYALALRRVGVGWAAASGLMSGLTMVIKPILGPFPLVAIGCLWWRGKAAGRPWAAPSAFVVPLMVMMAAPKILTFAGSGDFEGKSYSGIQFYGRTAQWTKLKGGIYPELKAEIAPLVERYRAMEKTDNNLVIKRLIVPAIDQHIGRNPGHYPSVNKVCRQLAFEAIRAEPRAFLAQAWSDFSKMHVKIANRTRLPSSNDLVDVLEEMRAQPQLPRQLHREETIRVLESRAKQESFAFFESLSGWSWLFRMWPPVLWTSLLAVPLVFATRGEHRLLWIALASLWYFNVVLLSVIGKPMNRYVVPVTPVMFWALSYPFILIWLRVLAACGSPRGGANSSDG